MSGLFAFAILERLLTSTTQATNHDNESETDSDCQNNNDTGRCPIKKKLANKAIKSDGIWVLSPFYGMSSKKVRSFPSHSGIDHM